MGVLLFIHYGWVNALVLDLSFPVLPRRRSLVPMIGCRDGELCIGLPHADMLERCSLVIYCISLTKDLGRKVPKSAALVSHLLPSDEGLWLTSNSAHYSSR
jgi:hypothetical protein